MEFSHERAAFLRWLAAHLFSRPIHVAPTREELAALKRVARAIYSNPKTNLRGKTWEESAGHTIRGFIVDFAAHKALGQPMDINHYIDLRNEDSYNHDVIVEYEGQERRIEIKSITPNHQNHELISYNARASQTLEKHRDKLSAIVFGNLVPLTPTTWDVEFRWIMHPDFFVNEYLLKSGEGGTYYRINPRAVHRLRQPDALIWNRHLLTELTFEE